MAFREQAMMVMQIQLTKRQDVVPITRDYIPREEAGCARSNAASARRCGSPANNPAFQRQRSRRTSPPSRLRMCESGTAGGSTAARSGTVLSHSPA